MKIVQRERLIDEGGISSTLEWQKVEKDIIDAIATIKWPPTLIHLHSIQKFMEMVLYR